MPVYVPSFITGSHFHGTVELNGIEIFGEDDEGIDFVADDFYAKRVKPKLQGAPITQIELWDLQCSGQTFNELIGMLAKHMTEHAGDGAGQQLKDFRVMSQKALQGVSAEALLPFA